MAVINDYINSKIPSEGIVQVGIGGFLLSSIVDETVNLNSQVPITYLEDGSNAVDNIVLEPTTLNIRGSIGEVFSIFGSLRNFAQRIFDVIGDVTAFSFNQTPTQTQSAIALVSTASDSIDGIDNRLDAGQMVLNDFGLSDSDDIKQQQQAFMDFIERVYISKSLISIDMPYRKYDNMRINGISITRDNQNSILNYNLTATQVRFVESQFVEADQVFKPNPSPGNNGATESLSNKGVQTPVEATAQQQSLLSSAFSNFSG